MSSGVPFSYQSNTPVDKQTQSMEYVVRQGMMGNYKVHVQAM
jgi:hypothetical protein